MPYEDYCVETNFAGEAKQFPIVPQKMRGQGLVWRTFGGMGNFLRKVKMSIQPLTFTSMSK